jgi:hypothetical protein
VKCSPRREILGHSSRVRQRQNLSVDVPSCLCNLHAPAISPQPQQPTTPPEVHKSNTTLTVAIFPMNILQSLQLLKLRYQETLYDDVIRINSSPADLPFWDRRWLAGGTLGLVGCHLSWKVRFSPACSVVAFLSTRSPTVLPLSVSVCVR